MEYRGGKSKEERGLEQIVRLGFSYSLFTWIGDSVGYGQVFMFLLNVYTGRAKGH